MYVCLLAPFIFFIFRFSIMHEIEADEESSDGDDEYREVEDFVEVTPLQIMTGSTPYNAEAKKTLLMKISTDEQKSMGLLAQYNFSTKRMDSSTLAYHISEVCKLLPKRGRNSQSRHALLLDAWARCVAIAADKNAALKLKSERAKARIKKANSAGCTPKPWCEEMRPPLAEYSADVRAAMEQCRVCYLPGTVQMVHTAAERTAQLEAANAKYARTMEIYNNLTTTQQKGVKKPRRPSVPIWLQCTGHVQFCGNGTCKSCSRESPDLHARRLACDRAGHCTVCSSNHAYHCCLFPPTRC